MLGLQQHLADLSLELPGGEGGVLFHFERLLPPLHMVAAEKEGQPVRCCHSRSVAGEELGHIRYYLAPKIEDEA